MSTKTKRKRSFAKSSVEYLNDFLSDKLKLGFINDKIFRIGKWSKVSQIFFDLFVIGIILVLLVFFGVIHWIVMWIYFVIGIIVCGFVFTKPNKKYNILLVIGFFFVLMFIPSRSGQIMLLSISPEKPINPYAEDTLEYTAWNEGWNGYIGGLNREENKYAGQASTVPSGMRCRDAWWSGWDKCKEYTEKIQSGEIANGTILNKPDSINPYREGVDQYDAWEEGYIAESLEDNPYSQITQPRLFHAFEDGYRAKHGYKDLGYVDMSEVFNLETFTDNPLENLNVTVTNIINIGNWILFLCIIGFGIAGVGDVISFNWGDLIKKIAIIAMAILILTTVYVLFQMVGVPVITVWDTVGNAWNDMSKNLGFAQLNVITGEIDSSPQVVINNIFKWIPLFFVIGMLSFSLYFRKRDLKSILFARNLTDDYTIEVKRTSWSIPVLVLLIVMVIYIVGYFLVSAEPTLTINPIITLVFYISAIVIIVLLGSKVLIINRHKGVSGLENTFEFVKSCLLWTIYGICGLFLWFQVMQPVFYNLNLTDSPSYLTQMAQGFELLESNYLEQIFLVATPETLIFQVGIVGIGNRIYYTVRKGKLIERERERLINRKQRLINQLSEFRLTEDISRKNLRRIAKMAIIQKEISSIDFKLESGKIQKLPYSYFVIPTIVFALLGSFVFSSYHAIRRGYDFGVWWQHPELGMNYFGAGFFLSFISFFSWIAGILTHALNNIIAIIIMGG